MSQPRDVAQWYGLMESAPAARLRMLQPSWRGALGILRSTSTGIVRITLYYVKGLQYCRP